MKIGQIIFSAGPNDGQPKPSGKSCLEVNAATLVCKIGD